MTRSKELVSYSWKPLSPEASTFPPTHTHTHTHTQRLMRTSGTFCTFAYKQTLQCKHDKLLDDSSSSISTISTSEIQSVIERLKGEYHHDSTKQSYLKTWKTFNQFIICLDVKPNNWEDHINLFAGFLADKKCKSVTIKSYVSAIKAVLSYANIRVQEDRVLLSSLTRACQIKNDVVHNKLPIHKDFLRLLIQKLMLLLDQQPYLLTMYKALFLTTYFGLFRIGELTQSKHVIQAVNTHVGENKKKIMFIQDA